jgi:aminoglycoside 3-N-acetyltransferase I
MTPAAVRMLGTDDVAALRAVNRLFAGAFDDADSYLDRPPSDAWLAAFLAQSHVAVFVAEATGATVGALTLYLLMKPEQERTEGYIYDLAVAEDHRRRGIARRLIAAACAWAWARGAWVVYVQADHGDDPAIALYSGLGTREDVLHFDIPVPRRTTE